jgi:hypothetical protein
LLKTRREILKNDAPVCRIPDKGDYFVVEVGVSQQNFLRNSIKGHGTTEHYVHQQLQALLGPC